MWLPLFVLHLSADFPSSPTPATSHFRKTKGKPNVDNKTEAPGQGFLLTEYFPRNSRGGRSWAKKSVQPPQVDTDGKNGRPKLQTGSVEGGKHGLSSYVGQRVCLRGSQAIVSPAYVEDEKSQPFY